MTAPPSISRTLQDVHDSAILNIRFNIKGTYAMTCCQDGSAKLINPHNAKIIKSYLGPHAKEINDVAIATDNSKFVTVGGDKMGYMWDVQTARIIRRFQGHDGRVNSCQLGGVDMHSGVTHDDALLFTASYDKTLKVWDARTPKAHRPIQTLADAKDAMTSIIVHKAEIISGSVDGQIRTYDIRMGEVKSDNLHHPITSMTMTSDFRFLLCSCLDNKIRLINRSTGKLINTYGGHLNSKYRIQSAFDGNDKMILSGSEDGRFCVWDVGTEKPEDILYDVKVPTKEGAKNNVVFVTRVNPNTPTQFVTGGSDGSMQVWETT
eukprot:GHVO01010277.1.p1 GENE.GHVO01010277.1~~GHVO01010277.1.p1  ORF type:complete len:328 (-),score=46.88 GHVO01010277.1:174-1133(-)